MSSKTIPAEFVAEIYDESGSNVRSCEFCNKWEAPGEARHLCCSRCKQVAYCSKECQIKDWKRPGGHKEECQKLGSSPLPSEALEKLGERIDAFSYLYKQLLMHLTLWATSDPANEGRTFQDPRVLCVYLEDLPTKAPKPRLKIKHFVPTLLAVTPASIQQEYWAGKARGPAEMGPRFRRFELCVLMYEETGPQHPPFASIMPLNFDTVSPLMLVHDYDAQVATVTRSREVIVEAAARFANTINEMAENKNSEYRTAANFPESKKSSNKKTNKNGKKKGKK